MSSIFDRPIIISEDGTWRYADSGWEPEIGSTMHALLRGSQWSPGLVPLGDVSGWSEYAPIHVVAAMLAGRTEPIKDHVMDGTGFSGVEVQDSEHIYVLSPPNYGADIRFAAVRQERLPVAAIARHSSGELFPVTMSIDGIMSAKIEAAPGVVTIMVRWPDGTVAQFTPDGTWGDFPDSESWKVDYSLNASDPGENIYRSLGEAFDAIERMRYNRAPDESHAPIHKPIVIRVSGTGTDTIDVGRDPVTGRPVGCIRACDNAGGIAASRYWTKLVFLNEARITMTGGDASRLWKPRLGLLEVCVARFAREADKHDTSCVGIGSDSGVYQQHVAFEVDQRPSSGLPAPDKIMVYQNTDRYWFDRCFSNGAGMSHGIRTNCIQVGVMADPFTASPNGTSVAVNEVVWDVGKDAEQARRHIPRLRLESDTPFAVKRIGSNGELSGRLEIGGATAPLNVSLWDQLAQSLRAVPGISVEVLDVPPDAWDYGPLYATLGPAKQGAYDDGRVEVSVVDSASGKHVIVLHSSYDVHHDVTQLFPANGNAKRGRGLIWGLTINNPKPNTPPIFVQQQGNTTGANQCIDIVGLFCIGTPSSVRPSTMSGRVDGTIAGVVIDGDHRIVLQPGSGQRPAFEMTPDSSMGAIHCQVVDGR